MKPLGSRTNYPPRACPFSWTLSILRLLRFCWGHASSYSSIHSVPITGNVHFWLLLRPHIVFHGHLRHPVWNFSAVVYFPRTYWTLSSGLYPCPWRSCLCGAQQGSLPRPLWPAHSRACSQVFRVGRRSRCSLCQIVLCSRPWGYQIWPHGLISLVIS